MKYDVITTGFINDSKTTITRLPFLAVWTITIHCCMVYLTAYQKSHSQSRTPPHVSSLASDDATISRPCYASCIGFLSGDQWIIKLHVWCTSRCLVGHLHTQPMTSTSSPTKVAVYSDRLPIGHASFLAHKTVLVTETLFLRLRVCETTLAIVLASCNISSSDRLDD